MQAIASKTEWVVARVWADEAELEAFQGNANARLIAAAPEMYAALHDALALFEKNHALSRFNWGASGLRAEDIRELNETPLKIRAALLAAEGGKP